MANKLPDSEMSTADHFRKAKWHGDRADTIGNANIADSHALSGLLKQKLAAQTKGQESTYQNAKGQTKPLDDKGWPEGTGKWAFR